MSYSDRPGDIPDVPPPRTPRRARQDIEDNSNSPRRYNYEQVRPLPSREHTGSPMGDYLPAPGGDPNFGRKKSLVRPERSRITRDHPQYHYRQHAQAMPVMPSATGNDPMMEDDDTISGDSHPAKEQPSPSDRSKNYSRGGRSDEYSDPPNLSDRLANIPKVAGKLSRGNNAYEAHRHKQKNKHDRSKEVVRPLSFWNVYCAIITFWCPNFILRCMGKPSKAEQRAWREKMGFISLIITICAIVGFLTFGFTQAVCGTPGLRLKINHVTNGYMIFHGSAYDLSQSKHPAALGIPFRSNVLYDLPEKNGGKDGSFLFQYVNGACKGLITPSPGSDVPTNADGDLAWYFPCVPFNQDGSSEPNKTYPYNVLGYGCHTSAAARDTFWGLKRQGEVFFTWDDIKNSSRNLMVYSGNVIDLDLLAWFNGTQVTVPAKFEELRHNPKVKGVDVTHAFQSRTDKAIANCLSEIVKVGSIDTETVGCIASKVVLYISLIFIVSIVLVKFFLALFFRWFFSRKFAAPRMKTDPNSKSRQDAIEEWSEDPYRPAPKVASSSIDLPNRFNKRNSFFPTTSRFSNPHAVSTVSSRKAQPTTFAAQKNQGDIYKQGNPSRNSLIDPSRSSLMLGREGDRFSTILSDSDSGPSGFVSDMVVPQPPPEYQPFGYPLAHNICLVTAYSEGELGIRSTIDSIATTAYPNSHKLILVICDGLIKGKGETETTPDIVLNMMTGLVTPAEEVQAYSYVAVASGSKRHNMARVYAGFYDYADEKGERVPLRDQKTVPMLLVVKCGTEDEQDGKKPGNRGKRDSQIILMSFLQKVMFDERMTELEYEMFNGIWNITGISPDYYEMVLMVDADTRVFPDSLTHMVSAMVKDPEIMGLCGETKIANKRASWVTMIQVFEYFISHHLTKSFESVFGGVTCLPGCFCMYRIKAPKGAQNYWVPILANPDVVEHYSENVVDTLHKKNLLLLGEDRYLTTLMLKTFPKRKQVFVPQAVCKTTVPDTFGVLLSQRRRWINSTVHNLMELVLVRDLCGTFCFSMQFVIFIELIGTVVLPAAITFTFYLIIISIVRKPVPVIPLILLCLILGLPAVLIVLTAHRWSYVAWMFIYLLSLPIWNLVLPSYAYWKFDDFSWGDTRQVAADEKVKKAGIEYEGEFDSTKITMKRWADFEKERRARSAAQWPNSAASNGSWYPQQPQQPYDHFSEN